MNHPEKNQWASVLCVFLASVCFSLGGLFIKLIPWQALAINGARNLIGAAVIGIYLLITRHKLVFSRQVFIGAAAMIGVTTLFAVANKLTTAANAIVLQFTAPAFVILLMALLYHEKPRRVDLLTCGAVLLGVILFFVDGIQAGNLPGNIAAVVSGVCYAGVFMMNTGEKADAISSCFLGQLTAGVLLTPLCFGETDFSVPTLAAVFALGAVQVGGAYILFSLGIKRTPPVTASLITGMEPIMNPLWVALFYGEAVSTLSVIGSVIVVGSIVLYNVWLTKRSGEGEKRHAGQEG
ncbi:MAG: EamA family transporter [Clostridia bacterium]|nr:EamA family transporter [Clostridia bacterium]